MENKEYPIIKALPRKGGWKFWCPFCKKWHLHGASEGHRVAHCFCRAPMEPYSNIESPFRKTGYILKKMTKKELTELSKAIDPHINLRARLRYLKTLEKDGYFEIIKRAKRDG